MAGKAVEISLSGGTWILVGFCILLFILGMASVEQLLADIAAAINRVAAAVEGM